MEYYETDLLTKIDYPVTELAPLPLPEEAPKAESPFWRVFRGQFWGALVLGAAVFTMQFWWPQGLEAVKGYLVCQETGPVEAAAQVFVAELIQGEPVTDAVTVFCQEILENLEAGHGSD